MRITFCHKTANRSGGNRVVADDALETTVMEIANTIADNAPMTIATIKQSTIEVLKDADKQATARIGKEDATKRLKALLSGAPATRSVRPFDQSRSNI